MADIISALQNRSKSFILLFTAGILLAVASLQLADLYARRRQVISTAEGRAENLAYVLAEYVRGTFANADIALRHLIETSHGLGIDGSDDAWAALLDSTKGLVPAAGAVSVLDDQGVIRHSTMRTLVGIKRSDQYLVKRLSATGRDELAVDTPIQSTVDETRFLIPIGRRLMRDDRFAGIVVITIRPEIVRDFFHTVDDGRYGISWIFHPAGILLLQEPDRAGAVGESVADNPVLQQAVQSGGRGVIHGTLRTGGVPYISAFQTTLQPPLYVTVSLREDEVLADWKRQRRNFSLMFLAVATTMAGMVAVLFRQMEARAGVERALHDTQVVEASRLRDANEKLEEALEREQRARRETEAISYLKDEFLMTVSHELRTPMTAIYGWVRMLSTNVVAPSDMSRALAVIERNARAQTQLIDDLLDVSRAISGKLRIQVRPVNVAEVAAGAVETVRPALDAKSIELETAFDDDLPTIQADPDRLQQIIWNLLSNAIKFTPDGGTVRLQVGRIESTATNRPDALKQTPRKDIQITVADNGVGIPTEFLPYVFERFRQAEAGTRRRYGGLGLGLAIVRALVELHGGRVRAESEGEGRGAAFTVTLPARAPRGDLKDTATSSRQRSTAARPSDLTGISALVVDDEPDARELFASMLAMSGATVHVAASAADALAILESVPVDVLVSDIEMPVEDGYELLKKARAHPKVRNAGLIAVAVTAHARPVDQRRALEAGFDSHLTKPVDPAELAAVVSSLLARGHVPRLDPEDRLPARRTED